MQFAVFELDKASVSVCCNVAVFVWLHVSFGIIYSVFDTTLFADFFLTLPKWMNDSEQEIKPGEWI